MLCVRVIMCVACKFQMPAAAKRVVRSAPPLTGSEGGDSTASGGSGSSGSSSGAGSDGSGGGGAGAGGGSFPFDSSTVRKQQQLQKKEQQQQQKEQSGSGGGGGGTASQFHCHSIESFVEEYQAYAGFFAEHKPLAAKIYQVLAFAFFSFVACVALRCMLTPSFARLISVRQAFLRFVQKKVAEDAAFAFNESKDRGAGAVPGEPISMCLTDKDFALLSRMCPGTDLFAISVGAFYVL